MKLFVIPNFDKQGTRGALSVLGGLAARLPFELYFTPASAEGLADIPARFLPFERALSACDVVVAVGGDGTILHAAKAIVHTNRPLLGVNTGHLGFLSTLEADEIPQMERLLTGDYTLEQRMLLSVEAARGGQVQKYIAFNDAAVTRGASARMIDAIVTCEGAHVASYRADGVVFSTPSGSTAYALSAGGPIVDPALRLIEMTPVCAHTLFARTMLFSADKCLCVTAPGSEEGRPAYLNVDGEDTLPLDAETEVRITAARECVRLVNLIKRPFFDTLGQKILSPGGPVPAPTSLAAARSAPLRYLR